MLEALSKVAMPPAGGGLVNLNGEGRVLRGEMTEFLPPSSLLRLTLEVETLSLEGVLEPDPGGDELLCLAGGDGALGKPFVGLGWTGVLDVEPRLQEDAESDLVGPVVAPLLL